MKMMGIRTPASANSRWKSRPLTPGSLTSRTRQLGPSGRLLPRNSCAVPKVSERKPTDFSMPWMAARTKSSSSTTNTVGVAAGVIHALQDAGGRVGGRDGAAARLGLKRTTFITRMKKLGIDPNQVSERKVDSTDTSDTSDASTVQDSPLDLS